MRVAFLDDSEQTNPPRSGLGHLFAFAAAIFPQEGGLGPFAEDLSRIVSSPGIPPGEELKWNPAKGTFLRSAGGPLVKTLRRQMLEAAASHHVRSGHARTGRPRPLPQCGAQALADTIIEGLAPMRADTTGLRTDTVQHLLGRKPGTFAAWCARSADVFRRADTRVDVASASHPAP